MITLRDLSIGFCGPLVLDHVQLHVQAGQRIGLLGRNGAGKTTFLRILSGEVEPDRGEVLLAPGTSVSLLPQDVPEGIRGSVFDVVAGGITIAQEVGAVESAWQVPHRVERILSRMSQMELNAKAMFELLSPGMKRRVLLARALVSEPDLLLLDEPTNHLDLDAITWLEDFLIRWNTTLIFVTHDRMFLRKLANRILEIDRGRILDWSCDYDTFLVRKEAALAAEEKQNALFDKRLAGEEAWIRQGIKARRTRNEGRVRILQRMRCERRQRRPSDVNVRMEIQEGKQSGRLVVKADRISFAFGDQVIVRDFSTTILRGDKVGIIGSNGVGKTTLLRIILGQLPPEQGTVRLGTHLQIAYFDQRREQLDEEASIEQNVGQGYDTIRIGGRPRHILGYLKDFLFTPERARLPVRLLSGGERNRVLLARLFTRPANVIVLDEPTNDLDAETLELLESRLVCFDGTVLLVSHDRTFLNNVVTSTIVFEKDLNGNRRIREYVGGYDDWIRQRPEVAPSEPPNTEKQQNRQQQNSDRIHLEKSRLSYNEQRELAALPARIEALESEIDYLHQTMAKPEFYRQPGSLIAQEHSLLIDLETQLAAAYEKWEELETRNRS
ncbi:MAG: ATP-binding cassette domain-containing protein [Pirellulales bacterium]|nr:ATP-binding cassette domain-containing protein [Pirellulales bacterium]